MGSVLDVSGAHIEAGHGQVRSLQVGPAQVGVGQVGSSQVGHLEVDVAQIQARQIGAVKVQTLTDKQTNKRWSRCRPERDKFLQMFHNKSLVMT